jgi:two-component system sensor histidine kinase ChiS
LLGAVLAIGCSAQPPPRAIDGRLDLRNWSGEALPLAGDWRFRPGLASPAKPERLREVPGSWTGVRDAADRPLDGTASATYRLRIELPQRLRDRRLAIRLPDVGCAQRLELPGGRACQLGELSHDPGRLAGRWAARVCAFEASNPTLEITLKLTCTGLRHGGLTQAPRFGEATRVRTAHQRGRARDLLLIGCLATFGLLSLLFSALRRDRPTLYFGLLCLCIALRTGAEGTGSRVLIELIPAAGAGLVSALTLLTLFWLVALMSAFITSLFPQEDPWQVNRGVWPLAGGLSVAFLLGADTSWLLIMIELVAILALAPYTLVLMIQTVRRRRTSARLMLGGMVLFIAFATHDTLIDSGLLFGPLILPFGLLGLVVAQAAALAQRNSSAFSSIERLSRELEQRNRALAAANRAKDEFLATTAHELRTPVAGMIGLAEAILQQEQQLSETSAKQLSLVVSSGLRLSKLIDQVLDISRLEAGDVSLRRRPVKLDAAVESTLALLQPMAREAGLEVRLELERELPAVDADEARLLQVLHNLVGNAIKYTPSGGRVLVTAAHEGEQVVLAVSDTGPGIDEAQLERSFRRHGRGDHSESIPGSGLGLAIARQLVEAHGSELRYERPEGGGSRFSFSLRVLRQAKAVAPMAETPAPRDEERPLVVVVDDEQLMLEVVDSQLSAANLDVLTCDDPERAMELIEEREPDLAILDVTMPKLSGYQLCEQLRRRLSPSELPIILLTARDELDDLVSGFARGANDYVTKPFAREELVARVRAQLALRLACERLERNLRLETEVERQRLVSTKAQVDAERARDETLRYQLRPHFLFNALASIRGAMEADPSLARTMVSDLGELCQRLLTLGPKEQHPLDEELEIIDLYLAMEQKRRPRLTIERQIDAGLGQQMVPTLALQLLVENALKHGRPAADGELRVRLEACLDPAGALDLRVENSGRLGDRSGAPSGHGLANLRRRLERNPHQGYHLEIEEVSTGVRARLSLPAS